MKKLTVNLFFCLLLVIHAKNVIINEIVSDSSSFNQDDIFIELRSTDPNDRDLDNYMVLIVEYSVKGI